MKNKFLFLISIVLVLLIGLSYNVNADESVTISLFYDSTISDSYTIMNGDEVGVIVSADSVFEDSMNIDLDLLNTNGEIVARLLNVDTTSDSYSKYLIVGYSSYLAPGDYILKGHVLGEPSGNMDTDELYLEVKSQTSGNHPPVITSSPSVTQIDEHDIFDYQVIATDEDNDPLTYSLIQAPNWLSISNNGFVTGASPEVNFDYQFIATVRVSDGQDFDTQTFTIDVKDIVQNAQPNIEILTPSENEYISGEYTIRWQAIDINQPSNTLDVKIEYTYDGYEWYTLIDGKNIGALYIVFSRNHIIRNSNMTHIEEIKLFQST